MTGSVLDGDLPGERPVSRYRDGELTLTNLRVRYKGRALRRGEAAYIRLRDVTAVRIGRAWGFQPVLLSIPAAVLLFFFLLMLLFEDEDPFIFGLFMQLFVVPVTVLFMRGRAIRIATPGEVLRVPLPRRSLVDAQAFLNEIEAARHSLDADPAPAEVGRPVPTTTAFGR